MYGDEMVSQTSVHRDGTCRRDVKGSKMLSEKPREKLCSKHLLLSLWWLPAINMLIQEIVNLLCVVLAFSMFAIIIKKLRCRKNTEKEGERKYELRLSTELMIHSFFILLTLWHISRWCLSFVIPVFRYFDWTISKRNEKVLCRALVINTLTIGALYQMALNNILVNRANNAFKGLIPTFLSLHTYCTLKRRI